MRVQIPPYTDRWMRGDRYGEVVGIHKVKRKNRDGTKIDGPGGMIEVAVVELDVSGKTIRVVLDDCTVVSL